jgi:hypothetical protein
VIACLQCSDASRCDLGLLENSAFHVQVKVKNAMVVTFIAGSMRSVCHEEAGGDGTPHVGEVQARLQKLSQLFGPSYADIAISLNSACRSESTIGLLS